MPELKNSFTGGKMNKDLDERIIPSTEYREALNISVATSEDSNVGAAQNILGNTRVSCAIQGPNGKYAERSKHIAAIADPQTDKIYRFIHTPDNVSGVWMDRIIEFDTTAPLNAECEDKEKAVMVDIYKVRTTITDASYECDGGPATITVQGNIYQLRWGMLIVGGGIKESDGVTVLSVNILPGGQSAKLKLSNNINGDNTQNITNGDVILTHDRSLNFDPDRFITGINVLDNMIFWTDNYSEPKKINIERGLAGSLVTSERYNSIPAVPYIYDSFDQHTRLVIWVNEEWIVPTECSIVSPNGCGPGEPVEILGCTDGTGASNPNVPNTGAATNYNALATVDDGSCVYPPVPCENQGCNDPIATNYDPINCSDCAGVVGGTNYSCCVYPVVPCPGTLQIYFPEALMDMYGSPSNSGTTQYMNVASTYAGDIGWWNSTNTNAENFQMVPQHRLNNWWPYENVALIIPSFYAVHSSGYKNTQDTFGIQSWVPVANSAFDGWKFPTKSPADHPDGWVHKPRWEILWRAHDQGIVTYRNELNGASPQPGGMATINAAVPLPTVDDPINWNQNNYDFIPEFFQETIDSNQGFHHVHSSMYSQPEIYYGVRFKSPQDFLTWMNRIPEFVSDRVLNNPTFTYHGSMIATHTASHDNNPQWVGTIPYLNSGMLRTPQGGIPRFSQDPETAFGTSNITAPYGTINPTNAWAYQITAKTLMTDVIQKSLNKFYQQAGITEIPIITRSTVQKCLE